MNDQKHYSHDRLTELLNDQLSVADQSELETHLENCAECRTHLEELAAEPHDWDKAATHLSNSDELRPQDWMVTHPTVAIDLEKKFAGAGTGSNVQHEFEDVPLDAPSHPEMLGRIDGFEIEKVIGRGGCGVVYKGFDRELNRPVAIKVLAPHLASNGVARQRFAREARAAAAVVHPNVVPIHSVSSEPDRPYIVMSLVNGRSLEAHVRENGPMELKDTVRIAQQIAAGLQAAHRQGLIHRDIKPANILLEQDVSRVMITDFGLARAADEAAITQTGWLAGTPHYMSPEQAKGSEIDQRSDLFSLGSLIYFMATGREPFRAEKPFAVIQKIINEIPEKARQVNSDISKTLSQIIERLLSKNPKDRFQSAEAVHQTLEMYLAHLQNPLASPKPKGILNNRKTSRAPLLVAFAVVLLIAAGLYGLKFSPFFGSPLQEKTHSETTSSTMQTAPTLSPFQNTNPRPNSLDSDSLLPDDVFQTELNRLANDITGLENQMEWEGSFEELPNTVPADQPAQHSNGSTLQPNSIHQNNNNQ